MKRFHETNKWEDPWFSALPFKAKLAWDYILSKCDNAGVWAPNTALADFQIGTKIDWEEFRKTLGDRVRVIRAGKWWIPSFVKFQYGRLSPDARVHQSIIRVLEGHGLVEMYNQWLSDGIAIPLVSHSDGIAIPTRQRQGQEEGQRQGHGPDPEPPAADPVSPQDIYAAYPRKEARQVALKAISKAMVTTPPAKLLAATTAYAAAVGRWPPEDLKFVPHPATWFNRGSYDDDPRLWERSKPVLIPTPISSIPANLRDSNRSTAAA